GSGDARWDARSYVAIHTSLIFGVATLITGSIWAKGSWGHWWVWDEPTLVSFLIVFLLYATYQPLRFAIEDPERQSRYASVFAVTAGAFVPMNFIAVRLSTAYLHPRVLGGTSKLPGPMAFTFVVCLVAIALLYATLCKYELTAKHARAQVRALRRRLTGEQPAAPRTGRSAAPSLQPAATMSARPAGVQRERGERVRGSPHGHAGGQGGGRDLHVQPHRDVCGRGRSRAGGVRRAGAARRPRPHPSDGAGGSDVLAPQLRRGPPP